MKRKFNFIAVVILITLSSCTQRACQRWEKKSQYTERSYELTLYSGGKPVYQDKFRGIVNEEENTDGFFYFKNDTLVEISGDYIIKSLD